MSTPSLSASFFKALSSACMLALVLFGSGCGQARSSFVPIQNATSSQQSSSTSQLPSTQPTPIRTLSDSVLKNLTYPAGIFAQDVGKNAFTLQNGIEHFVDHQVGYPGYAQLDPAIGRGDLDGDGYEDAVVSVRVNTGGTGMWSLVYVVMNEPGHPKAYLSTLPHLDDRDLINRITIRGGKVTFDLTVHASNDPSCCPSVHKVETFKFKNNQLVLLSV